MRKPLTYILYLLCTLTVVAGCHTGSGKQERKTGKPEMITGKRCSFDLPSGLILVPIDTNKFSPDGYYKIHSRTTQNTLQLFVFEGPVDINDKVSNQVSHINAPDVFYALSTHSLNQFGQYKGQGVLMTGMYEGTDVHGQIRIFAANGPNRGFLIIRQHVAGNDEDLADFELLENSFLLK